MGPYAALLFDMDGTILTSIAAVERAWRAWAHRVNVSEASVLHYMHGRRALDTIRHFLPNVAEGVAQAEAAWLEACEMQDMDGISEIPGARAFLSALPKGRWAVVTSATRPLALQRIAAAGLPLPEVLIAADDVDRGKPDPAGYLMAAAALQVDAADCAVFEDAPAGIASGRAAGAQVIIVAGNPQSVAAAGHRTIHDYGDLGPRMTTGGVCIVGGPGRKAADAASATDG